MSDIHTEFHHDQGVSLVASLPPAGDVDVCILAGDIAVGPGIVDALALFCGRYEWVVYVHGNHEFYESDRSQVLGWTTQAAREQPNLRWLHPHEDVPGSGPIEIAGRRFIGAPLWFENAPGNSTLRESMTDFSAIDGFDSWVYEENTRTRQLFEHEMRAGDIVVTHHLPSQRSIAPEYVGHPLNCFFVCDLEALISARQPALWVHGHTHSSLDYSLGSTRVVCNPFGYARVAENPKFDFAKVIEVQDWRADP